MLKLFDPRFLSNRREPKDKASHDLLASDENILAENSIFMKQRFREVAQKIRRIKAFKR
ncbi:MAG: hypothetical protein ABI221_02980 [Candidatus Saccharimonadales bacterium]